MAEKNPDDHPGKKLKSDKYDIPDIKYECKYHIMICVWPYPVNGEGLHKHISIG